MFKVLYVIAIGLFFAGVVGFGFAAFYPAPDFPELPQELREPSSTGVETEEEKALRVQINAEQEAYQEKLNEYGQNLSIGLIIVALLTLGISIMGMGKIEVIGDGLTLGGVFTLLYGLGHAVAAGDEKIRFIAVLFGLIVMIFLTYWKFIRPQKENSPAL